MPTPTLSLKIGPWLQGEAIGLEPVVGLVLVALAIVVAIHLRSRTRS